MSRASAKQGLPGAARGGRSGEPGGRAAISGKQPVAARARGRGYQAGRETRDRIVAAAEQILVQRGYARLTLKAVADAIGIAVGNLTYHFPNREMLLEALIERTLAEYDARFARLLSMTTGSSGTRLAQVLEWAVDDSSSKHYSHLFRELWAMALHNRSVARSVERFYAQSIEDVVGRLAQHSAPLGPQQLRVAIYLICAISEGCSVLFGTRPNAELCASVKRMGRRLMESLTEPVGAQGKAKWD